MTKLLTALALALALGLAPNAAFAAGKKVVATKAGKDEKVCKYKFPSGEKRTWVCKKAEPCCAWDAISYVKCGSTITGCL